MNFGRIISIGCLLAAVFGLLLMPEGLGSRELDKRIEDAAHVPLFAAVAIGVYVLLFRNTRSSESLWRGYGKAFFLAVGVGAMGELAQSLTATRHAEWGDLLNDVLGAYLGLAAYEVLVGRLYSRISVRVWLVAIGLIALIVVLAPVAHSGWFYIQRMQVMPVLLDPERASTLHFVRSSGAELRVVTDKLAAVDKSECRTYLRIEPKSLNGWPGAIVNEPYADWSGYRQLEIMGVNLDSKSARLYLRIDDGRHNQEFSDRFNANYSFAAGQQQRLIIPLSRVRQAPKGRELNLNDIAKIALFQNGADNPSAFGICSIRLAK